MTNNKRGRVFHTEENGFSPNINKHEVAIMEQQQAGTERSTAWQLGPFTRNTLELSLFWTRSTVTKVLHWHNKV